MSHTKHEARVDEPGSPAERAHMHDRTRARTQTNIYLRRTAAARFFKYLCVCVCDYMHLLWVQKLTDKKPNDCVCLAGCTFQQYRKRLRVLGWFLHIFAFRTDINHNLCTKSAHTWIFQHTHSFAPVLILSCFVRLRFCLRVCAITGNPNRFALTYVRST